MSMTSNAAIVDEDQFTVRRSIRIAAPVAKVWSAVTDPAHISQWFGHTVFDGAGVGARGTMTFPDHGAIPLRIEVKDEPRSVSYRWGNDNALGKLPDEVDDSNSTVFTFTLEPIQEGTLLTVLETGFETTSDARVNLESHRDGWNSQLDKLVALLESDV